MDRNNSWNIFSGRDSTVAVSYLVYLKMFDMVHIEKVKPGRADTGGIKHFFEGHMIP